MQDDERRLIIFIILMFLIIALYPYYFRVFYKSPKSIGKEFVLDQKKVGDSRIEEQAEEIAQSLSFPEEEEEYVLENGPLKIVIGSFGGTIKSVYLTEYKEKDGSLVLVSGEDDYKDRLFYIYLPDAPLVYNIDRRDNTVILSASNEKMRVTKYITFFPDSYILEAKLVIENLQPEENLNFHNIEISTGAIYPGNETYVKMYVSGVSFIEGKIRKSRIPKESTFIEGKVFWTAVRNKYFCIILNPTTLGNKVTFKRVERDDGRMGIKSLLSIPLDIIPPGSKYGEEFKIYVGPKKYEIVKSIAKDTEKVLDLGWFAPLSKVTLFILKFFYGLVHNYGVAIILLTLLVRLILYPLTYKSYKSMSEMQKLQPYIMELQKRYKNDPKRLHKEMMVLYKEHGVNPLGGCLPMLLQLPILIALFTTIRNAIELRGAPFCLWIKDLSEPDTLFRLPNGFPINILPLIMLGTFFLQYKFMHTPAVTPEQRQQQKMMNIIMPIFMGFIFYNMPSGLVLYFTLSTLIGLVDQYRIKKRLS